MEKYINIPTRDGFEIKGILNSKEKSDTLIIFVHGFTGSMGEAHYYCAKQYFTEKGYDVFRFNLYTSGSTTRKLRDCSVKIHSEDISVVADYFSGYKEIIFVGHSLAGPCLSGVNQYPNNVKKIVFWDPAFDMLDTADECYHENHRIKYQASGKHIEVSEEMYDEFMQDIFFKILEKQKFPKNNMYAIYADGDRHVDNKPATDAMGIASYIIQGANHGFTQEGKFEELFEKTLGFIQL